MKHNQSYHSVTQIETISSHWCGRGFLALNPIWMQLVSFHYCPYRQQEIGARRVMGVG